MGKNSYNIDDVKKYILDKELGFTERDEELELIIAKNPEYQNYYKSHKRVSLTMENKAELIFSDEIARIGYRKNMRIAYKYGSVAAVFIIVGGLILMGGNNQILNTERIAIKTPVIKQIAINKTDTKNTIRKNDENNKGIILQKEKHTEVAKVNSISKPEQNKKYFAKTESKVLKASDNNVSVFIADKRDIVKESKEENSDYDLDVAKLNTESPVVESDRIASLDFNSNKVKETRKNVERNDNTKKVAEKDKMELIYKEEYAKIDSDTVFNLKYSSTKVKRATTEELREMLKNFNGTQNNNSIVNNTELKRVAKLSENVSMTLYSSVSKNSYTKIEELGYDRTMIGGENNIRNTENGKAEVTPPTNITDPIKVQNPTVVPGNPVSTDNSNSNLGTNSNKNTTTQKSSIVTNRRIVEKKYSEYDMFSIGSSFLINTDSKGIDSLNFGLEYYNNSVPYADNIKNYQNRLQLLDSGKYISTSLMFNINGGFGLGSKYYYNLENDNRIFAPGITKKLGEDIRLEAFYIMKGYTPESNLDRNIFKATIGINY